MSQKHSENKVSSGYWINVVNWAGDCYASTVTSSQLCILRYFHKLPWCWRWAVQMWNWALRTSVTADIRSSIVRSNNTHTLCATSSKVNIVKLLRLQNKIKYVNPVITCSLKPQVVQLQLHSAVCMCVFVRVWERLLQLIKQETWARTINFSFIL